MNHEERSFCAYGMPRKLCNLLVHRVMLNQLRHSGQAPLFKFFCVVVLTQNESGFLDHLAWGVF